MSNIYLSRNKLGGNNNFILLTPKSFNKAINKYDIISFLNADPVVRIDLELVLQVDEFVRQLTDDLQKARLSQNDPRYHSIAEFASCLNSYSGNIGMRTQPHISGRYNYYRGSGDVGADNKNRNEIWTLRQNTADQLDKLYGEINPGLHLFV